MKLLLTIELAVNLFAYDECAYNLKMLNEQMQKGIISAKEADRISEKYYVDMGIIYNTDALVKCDKSMHETILKSRAILNQRKEFLKWLANKY